MREFILGALMGLAIACVALYALDRHAEQSKSYNRRVV